MTWKERLILFRSFWIFPSLALFLLLLTYRIESGARPSNLILLIPIGLLLWTLLEYGLHRFIFHWEIRNPKLRSLLGGSHIEHHEAPRAIDHLLVHTDYAMGISAALYTILVLASGNWFHATGVMTGIWAGFLYYEAVHYRVHRTVDQGRMIARQRRAHFHHHFKAPDRCFGVTTPLWDYVFGTRRAR